MTHEELWKRMKYIAELSDGALHASNQYGMLFLVTSSNGIVLCLNGLLDSPEEAQKARDAS